MDFRIPSLFASHSGATRLERTLVRAEIITPDNFKTADPNVVDHFSHTTPASVALNSRQTITAGAGKIFAPALAHLNPSGLFEAGASSFARIDAPLAVVEGSLRHAGLQPDYLIAPQDEDLRNFLATMSATHASSKSLEPRERIAAVLAAVGEALHNKSNQFPLYLELMASYRQAGQAVPLGAYVRNRCGVCREHALLAHLALRHVGIDAEFLYVQHVHHGRVEDHALNVVRIDGEDVVADSYYANYNLKPLRELWGPKGLLRVNSYPLVWQMRPVTKTPVKNEPDFARELMNSPVSIFHALRGRRVEAQARGGDPLDFPFPEMAPVMRWARQELATHLADPDALRLGLTPQLAALKRRADALWRDGYPYREVIAFARDFADALEPLAEKKWLATPGRWVSTYFTRVFRQNFEETVVNSAAGFGFPWSSAVNMDFFIRTRSSLVYLMGLRSFVDYTDGDPLGPDDFFFHDIEHALRQKIQTDLIFADLTDQERFAVQKLWERRISLLIAERDRLAREDAGLGQAFTYLLFELMHERGFAPDFQSLRDQTLSDRWTKVIEKKLLYQFWFKESRTSPDFATLEKARIRLNEFSLAQAALELEPIRLHFSRHRNFAKPIPVTARLQESAYAYEGRVSAVELEDVDKLVVALQKTDNAKLRRFPEAQINLEQIRFGARLIDPAHAALYAKAIALKKSGCVLAVRVHAGTGYPEIYDRDRQWRLFDAQTAANFDDNDLTIVALNSHYVYRLEQLLSLLQSGGSTDALVLKPAHVVRGHITSARGSIGDFNMTLVTDDGRKVNVHPGDGLILTAASQSNF